MHGRCEGLLEGHERYAPDDSDMHELFDAERTVNVRETSSMALRAAAYIELSLFLNTAHRLPLKFYSEIHSKLCPHVEDGVQCTGLPVYRRLKMVQLLILINLDGKGGLIGCQKYSRSQSRSHRFITINRDVKEELIQELLSNNGRFISDVNVDSESALSRVKLLDLQVEAKHRAMEESCVLVNHRNTKPQRDRNNASRRTTAHRQALERSAARDKLETIEDCLQRSAATTKELREQRKALKLASGVKKTKRTGEKSREILPNADEFAGLSDAESIQSSPVRPALHLCDDTTQVRANLEVELEAGLEPLFLTQHSTPYLELGGDLLDYIPT
ncbi:hypothetical protein B0H16DRAFT_1467994 [Mycena metata]|uniref:Uncharacterized protein n=1 Tax=Mycena metata TaxID=1033252 RepID=A0AAD7I3H4_9AGAR|nr:hypothetical protein B0H16DRAFT_1467994 [Mycena metata]